MSDTDVKCALEYPSPGGEQLEVSSPLITDFSVNIGVEGEVIEATDLTDVNVELSRIYPVEGPILSYSGSPLFIVVKTWMKYYYKV